MLALGPAMCCSGQPTAAGGCCPAPCRPGNVCGSHNPPPHGPAHLRRTRLLLSCRECCCCCCVDMAGLPHRHTALNCCPAPPRPADGSPLEMAGLSHAQSSVCRPLSSPVCSLPHQHCRRLPAGDGGPAAAAAGHGWRAGGAGRPGAGPGHGAALCGEPASGESGLPGCVGLAMQQCSNPGDQSGPVVAVVESLFGPFPPLPSCAARGRCPTRPLMLLLLPPVCVAGHVGARRPRRRPGRGRWRGG